jgi:hypothetical protein
MIVLSSSSDKPIKAHVAESMALDPELDFPDGWAELVDVSSYKFN